MMVQKQGKIETIKSAASGGDVCHTDLFEAEAFICFSENFCALLNLFFCS